MDRRANQAPPSVGFSRQETDRSINECYCSPIPYVPTVNQPPEICFHRILPTLSKLLSFLTVLSALRSTHGEGNGNPLQYFCLANPMDGGAWWAAIHGIARSPSRLSDFTFTFHFHALEKDMATHSSVLAWRIPLGSLVGCRLWGHTESEDTTEVT